MREETTTATWLGIALALAIPLVAGVVAYGRLQEAVEAIHAKQLEDEAGSQQHRRDDTARHEIWIGTHTNMAERITRLEEGRQRNADALAALAARVDHLNSELDLFIRGNNK